VQEFSGTPQGRSQLTNLEADEMLILEHTLNKYDMIVVIGFM
jgi:hypothetical protein